MHDEVLVPGVDLLESMRSVGYSFESALSDIIDNSITAGARNVDIVVEPIRAEFVTIFDDGSGMGPDEARDALRLAGSRNTERTAADLGRFGLGLKTASLSQARSLTILTRRDGETTALEWDLDHVLSSGNWSVRVLDVDDQARLPGAAEFDAVVAGTLVVWRRLDSLISGAADPSALIAEKLAALREHFGFTFQRFLDSRTQKLYIRVNGLEVRSIDPFLESDVRTQPGSVERVLIDGETMTFQAFTLPHPSAFGATERRRADLGDHMRDFQGFYVYRNQRLITRGGWFGLHRLDELSKQSRVRVDIPNTLDHHWQLDIKKSRIDPPQQFRHRFKQIIEQVTGTSKRVHRFRGRAESAGETVHLWELVSEREGYRYRVNAEHPLVMALRAQLPEQKSRLLDQVIDDLSATFPTRDLYVRMAENSLKAIPSVDLEGVRDRLRGLRDNGAADADPSDMTKMLKLVEPFDAVPDLGDLIESIWKESR